MERSGDRLVRRIQRRQEAVDPMSPAVRSHPREVAALEDRVRRLKAMGGRFRHVKLSAYVAVGDGRGAPVRVGGECVATEV
jgi:hypothetical protein